MAASDAQVSGHLSLNAFFLFRSPRKKDNKTFDAILSTRNAL